MIEAQELFDKQVARQNPIAVFADPDADQITCIWDEAVHTEKSLASFIFKAFDENSDLHLVKGEHRLSFERSSTPIDWKVVATDSEMDQGYAQMMQSARELLQRSVCDKIVLSRKKYVDLPSDFEEVKMLMTLQNLYPRALSYVLYHPNCGTWIGSTPETLIHKDSDEWRTMALAGTRPKGQGSEWTQKDIDEHEFVCDHIDQRLAQIGGHSIEKGPRETALAGPVEHLRTPYVFKYAGEIDDLLNLLHPTPAICGTPKELSYQKIIELEQHDRELYCGYIGPVSEQKTHLFVNLRCMKLEGSKAALFVGGGITRDSDPSLEWKETEMKAQTLMKVLQNL